MGTLKKVNADDKTDNKTEPSPVGTDKAMTHAFISKTLYLRLLINHGNK